jgi:glycosyltransferase involved in cell wall biosynthesis
MEAMLCGLPAVVSHVGDLGELVEDGVNGFLVADRTPEAFAARLVELLTDPGRLSRFAEAAHRSAERYEIHTVSDRWDEILADPAMVEPAAVGRSPRPGTIEAPELSKYDRSRGSITS